MYSGNWECGKESGKGKMTFANKDEYRGEFRMGMMHGQGQFAHKTTGNKYVGEFKEGEYE